MKIAHIETTYFRKLRSVRVDLSKGTMLLEVARQI